MTGPNLWDNLSERIAKQVNRIAFARKVSLRTEEREDVEQEANLAVYLALVRQNRLMSEDEVMRLTTAIATNKRTDALRNLYRPQNAVAEDSEAHLEHEAAGHDSDPAGQIESSALEDFFAQRLTSQQVSLLRLMKEEASYEEIAELLERPLNTVKSDIRRLRVRCEALHQEWNTGS